MSVFVGTHKSPADSVAKAAGMVLDSAKEGVKMAAHAVKDAAFALQLTILSPRVKHITMQVSTSTTTMPPITTTPPITAKDARVYCRKSE
jgi:hypothetical protein